MTFDPTAPVLALIIDPTDEVATLRPVAVNAPGGIGGIIGGSIEVIELDGGSVLWLDESGKNLGLPGPTPGSWTRGVITRQVAA